MSIQPITNQIKSNAVSAYFLLFVSGLFLFNKHDPALSHPFVKQHTKNALLIHVGFLVAYIVCISSGIFQWMELFGLALSRILFVGISLLLLCRMLYGIYMAHNKKLIGSKELLGVTMSDTNHTQVLSGENMSEKQKIDITLSYIPFLSFLQTTDTPLEQHNKRVTLCVSIIIMTAVLSENTNLASLMILFYSTYVVFQSIQLFSLEKVYMIWESYTLCIVKIPYYIKTLSLYTKQYISQSQNLNFWSTLTEVIQKNKDFEQRQTEIYQKKSDVSLPKRMIYLPIINGIYLSQLSSRYKMHILNGITISVLLLLILGLSLAWYMSYHSALWLLFPLCFWIGSVEKKLFVYLPVITDLWMMSLKWFESGKKYIQKIKKIQKTETHTTFGSDKNS